MGFIRLYLALCVVEAHAGSFMPWPAPRGRDAVEIFFIVSGFYMAMILSGRYATARDFYASRCMRIAVPYYLHFLAIVVLSVAAGLLFSDWLALAAYAQDPFLVNGSAGISAAALANLTIVGQDTVLFLRDNAGEGLRWTVNFAAFPDPLYRYLVIPQCWTVAIEIFFYLLAPFLIRLSSLHLAGVVAGSLFLRFVAYAFGLDHDPWTYRFGPFEIALFAAGMLAWRAFNSLVDHHRCGQGSPRPVHYALFCVGVILSGWLFRESIWRLGNHLGDAHASILLCLACAPLLVLAFSFTRNHPLDRLVGELSYPIYLNHLFIIVAVRALPLPAAWREHSGIAIGALSVLAAGLFWHFYLRQFERRRHESFGVAAA
jgi:peptidoglycan/LPS O-acetylase OafA/YrhL